MLVLTLHIGMMPEIFCHIECLHYSLLAMQTWLGMTYIQWTYHTVVAVWSRLSVQSAMPDYWYASLPEMRQQQITLSQ